MTDEAIETVRDAGGRVLAEPVAHEWGDRSGYFADPVGTIWELAWMPGVTFEARARADLPLESPENICGVEIEQPPFGTS